MSQTSPFDTRLSYAQQLDANDPLKNFRGEFVFPKFGNKPTLYFTGNSLGIMPKAAKLEVENELEKWSSLAVEGHFKGENPWFDYHKLAKKATAAMVGASQNEVVVMNTLTVNLHLLLVSFYKPTQQRFKIICEEKAFPSDQYALETQAIHHGFDPKDAIIEIKQDANGYISLDTIEATLQEHGDETAVLLMGGLNYYTGQLFDIEKITALAHKKGIIVGWDLAHVFGNRFPKLHDWNVDFATWCTYKYGNCGPGAPSGIFVHDKHGNNKSINRFAGWWGYNQETRFLMEPGFDPMPGADGWQLSNQPILAMSTVHASLDLFLQAGLERIREKQIKITGYLEQLLHGLNEKHGGKIIQILTPTDPEERGTQLSVQFISTDKSVFDYLIDNACIVDWREPGVIRFAPTALYNSYEDVWNAISLLDTYFEKH